MIALLILAAGESSRMRFPKALLTIQGETFVEHILHKAGEAGFDRVLIVTGPDHDAIAQHLTDKRVCTKNEDYMRGQISSVQKGIQALGNSVNAVMVWPVDQPLIQTETVQKLLAAHEDENRALTIPVYKQRKGHPVIYNRRAMDSALELQQHQTGKDLQTIYAVETTFVEVDDPGVVTDVDSPDDYEKYVTPLNRGA
jgi:molybdenum cofactor cytidylyltransferase